MDKEREEELSLNFDSGEGAEELRLAREELEADLAEGAFPETEDSGKFAAIPAEAVDTTAAGDTYAGFFLGGVLTGLDVPEAMRLASTAAAIAITRPGASPSIPTRAEVLQKMKQEA